MGERERAETESTSLAAGARHTREELLAQGADVINRISWAPVPLARAFSVQERWTSACFGGPHPILRPLPVCLVTLALLRSRPENSSGLHWRCALATLHVHALIRDHCCRGDACGRGGKAQHKKLVMETYLAALVSHSARLRRKFLPDHPRPCSMRRRGPQDPHRRFASAGRRSVQNLRCIYCANMGEWRFVCFGESYC
jgi:hypothetical protein